MPPAWGALKLPESEYMDLSELAAGLSGIPTQPAFESPPLPPDSAAHSDTSIHGGHFFAFLAAQSYSMPQSRQALSVGTAHGTALSQRSRSNSSSRSLPVLEEEAEGEMVLLDGPETAEHEMLVTATAQEPPPTASMAHMWSGSLRLEPRRRQRRMTAPARE